MFFRAEIDGKMIIKVQYENRKKYIKLQAADFDDSFLKSEKNFPSLGTRLQWKMTLALRWMKPYLQNYPQWKGFALLSRTVMMMAHLNHLLHPHQASNSASSSLCSAVAETVTCQDNPNELNVDEEPLQSAVAKD
ncbi:hypothetical protein QQF64_029887, partial [Cirrhinus molitorella]